MQAKLVSTLGVSLENAHMKNDIDLNSLNNELNFSKKEVSMSIDAFESNRKRRPDNFVSFS